MPASIWQGSLGGPDLQSPPASGHHSSFREANRKNLGFRGGWNQCWLLTLLILNLGLLIWECGDDTTSLTELGSKENNGSHRPGPLKAGPWASEAEGKAPVLLKELLTPSTASTRALTEPEHCTGETPPQGHQAQGRQLRGKSRESRD